METDAELKKIEELVFAAGLDIEAKDGRDIGYAKEVILSYAKKSEPIELSAFLIDIERVRGIEQRRRSDEYLKDQSTKGATWTDGPGMPWKPGESRTVRGGFGKIDETQVIAMKQILEKIGHESSLELEAKKAFDMIDQLMSKLTPKDAFGFLYQLNQKYETKVLQDLGLIDKVDVKIKTGNE